MESLLVPNDKRKDANPLTLMGLILLKETIKAKNTLLTHHKKF